MGPREPESQLAKSIYDPLAVSVCGNKVDKCCLDLGKGVGATSTHLRVDNALGLPFRYHVFLGVNQP